MYPLVFAIAVDVDSRGNALLLFAEPLRPRDRTESRFRKGGRRAGDGKLREIIGPKQTFEKDGTLASCDFLSHVASSRSDAGATRAKYLIREGRLRREIARLNL